jgi:hypothetical protein
MSVMSPLCDHVANGKQKQEREYDGKWSWDRTGQQLYA